MLGTDDFSIFDWFRDPDEQQMVEDPTSTQNILTNCPTLGLSSYSPVTDLIGIFNPGFKE